MSYANGTSHYNLPQTVGTDKRDWTDTNQAFADIDAAIHTAYETASTGASEITAIKSTVANLSNAQVTFQHDLDEVELTVGQQGTAITGLGNQIEELEDDCLDMICAVDEGTAQVATVAVENGKYFRYNKVLYIATANIAIGDTIVPNTNCKATNVATELEAIDVPDISALSTRVTTLETNQGTLTSLNTTDKSSLVAAINEVLSQIGGGGMPALDFTNALYTFDGTNKTYTAVKDCYLCGMYHQNSAGDTVTVDGVNIFRAGSYLAGTYIPPLKIKTGQVVAVSGIDTAFASLGVYQELV